MARLTPTGRIVRSIPYERLAQQEQASIRMMRKMEEVLLASGAKKVAVDMYEMPAVDYVSIEQRIMEAMRGEEET